MRTVEHLVTKVWLGLLSLYRGRHIVEPKNTEKTVEVTSVTTYTLGIKDLSEAARGRIELQFGVTLPKDAIVNIHSEMDDTGVQMVHASVTVTEVTKS